MDSITFHSILSGSISSTTLSINQLLSTGYFITTPSTAFSALFPSISYSPLVISLQIPTPSAALLSSSNMVLYKTSPLSSPICSYHSCCRHIFLIGSAKSSMPNSTSRAACHGRGRVESATWRRQRCTSCSGRTATRWGGAGVPRPV